MDEDDAGFARELRVETFARVEQKVRKLAGEFDPGGPGADDDKGERSPGAVLVRPRPLGIMVGRGEGALEGVAARASEGPRVVDFFECEAMFPCAGHARCRLRLHPYCVHQRVVLDGYPPALRFRWRLASGPGLALGGLALDPGSVGPPRALGGGPRKGELDLGRPCVRVEAQGDPFKEAGVGVGGPDGLRDAPILHRAHRARGEHWREDEEGPGRHAKHAVLFRVDALDESMGAPP
mmetsp:Transcript_46578/g.105256  ORF Transcript_46578/g.105256 Transcript_46578/m.105256 type:complete len:237 (-) Transcript_46578:562-1272(-)